MKAESFYQEANDMQDGWGNYLRKIDQLREKVKNNIPIDIKEACWVLYGESIGNGGYRDKFLKWAEIELPNKTFIFKLWEHLFYGWFELYEGQSYFKSFMSK